MSDLSDDAAALLQELCAAFSLDTEAQLTGDAFVLTGRRTTFEPLELSSLEQIAASLSLNPVRGVTRSSMHFSEVLLAIDDSRPTPWRFRRDDLVLNDHERGLEYTLGAPSRELSMGLILQLRPSSFADNAARIRRSMMPIDMRSRTEVHVLDYASDLFRRFLALRITSQDQKSPSQFKRYLNSFIFQVAYNMDLTLSIAQPEALLPPLLARRGGRPEDGFEAPRLFYDEELVSRYVAATASADVVSQYLGYYHVLEGQFEPLYNDFVVSRVRGAITAPGFSTKRDGDIAQLVRSVAKLVRERQNESSGIDEKRALRLVLEKYVDIENVASRIGSPDYIEALRNDEVSFSSGDRVDFSAASQPLLDSLANRIYKTRNAVVHAKTTEENRFRPRRDANELERETQLMRALAEEVIVGKSKILD